MVSVKRRSGESEEQLMKRFRKKVTKSRILSDVRRKRWHVSKSEQKRIAKRKAIRRAHRRQFRRRGRDY
jgi:small subunit ribosomal protein S21